MATIAAIPSSVSSPVTLDASGPFPALLVRHAGKQAWLNDRFDPIVDAEAWLQRTIGAKDPSVIVVIGLGLGFVLDALERRGSQARVLAMEPFADVIPHFLARRDWSSWLEDGRLQWVTGPSYSGSVAAWRALDPVEMPPVLVNPALASQFSALTAGCRMALGRARAGSRLDPEVTSVRQSMLHPQVLTALEHFASAVDGIIVEIGAYVGGATIAMARGIRDAGRRTPLVTIEPGGSYASHPHLPSSDIARDLRRNLAKRSLEHLVTLHHGLSSDPEALALVRHMLDQHQASIGMLCIDADGQVQRDFDLYLPYCADGCILSIDDYHSEGAAEKTQPTREAVDRLVGEGRASTLGIYGWGTWMGVYRRAAH